MRFPCRRMPRVYRTCCGSESRDPPTVFEGDDKDKHDGSKKHFRRRASKRLEPPPPVFRKGHEAPPPFVRPGTALWPIVALVCPAAREGRVGSPIGVTSPSIHLNRRDG